MRATAASSWAASASMSAAGPQDVVAAADDADEVGLQRQSRVELRPDDVGEQAAAHGEVGVAERSGRRPRHTRRGARRAGRPSRRTGPGCAGVGVGHALGERVAERDVARPGARRAAGGSLTAGPSPRAAAPASASRALVRLNGREPKNPERADSGEGWADSTRGMPPSSGRERAGLPAPEDRDERAAPRSTRASMARAVTASQPLPWWLAGAPGRTVSTRLSSSTPRSVHGVRSPVDGVGRPRSVASSV